MNSYKNITEVEQNKCSSRKKSEQGGGNYCVRYPAPTQLKGKLEEFIIKAQEKKSIMTQEYTKEKVLLAFTNRNL